MIGVKELKQSHRYCCFKKVPRGAFDDDELVGCDRDP